MHVRIGVGLGSTRIFKNLGIRKRCIIETQTESVPITTRVVRKHRNHLRKFAGSTIGEGRSCISLFLIFIFVIGFECLFPIVQYHRYFF